MQVRRVRLSRVPELGEHLPSPYALPATHGKATWLEVRVLWVLPEAQGKGVGSALLLEAESQIAAAGHDRAWLTCSGFNPRALAFYLRRGYRETRRQLEELEPALVDNTIILERSLTDIATNL